VSIKWILFFTLGIGGLLLYQQTIDYDLKMKLVLIERVKTISKAVNTDRFLNLKGDETDNTNMDYMRLKEQLTEICDVVDGARYVYIMAKKDNKTVLMVDTQPKKYGLGGLAQPGEVYEEFDPNIEDLLKNSGEKITGPYTDKWGTFVSGLSSITEKNSDKVVAMVGIDMEATKWQTGMWKNLGSRVVVLILIVIIEIVIFLSQRKNAKDATKLAYLASVLESSDDAIYSIDFDKKILSWNLGAEKLYGYTQDEVLGKDMTGILLPEGGVNSLNENLRILATGKRLGHQEAIRKTKSGKLITVSLILSPVYDDFGKVNSVSVIARDITKQKIEGIELEKHSKELEKMNKLMIDRELVMMELKKKIKQYEIKN